VSEGDGPTAFVAYGLVAAAYDGLLCAYNQDFEDRMSDIAEGDGAACQVLLGLCRSDTGSAIAYFEEKFGTYDAQGNLHGGEIASSVAFCRVAQYFNPGLAPSLFLTADALQQLAVIESFTQPLVDQLKAEFDEYIRFCLALEPGRHEFYIVLDAMRAWGGLERTAYGFELAALYAITSAVARARLLVLQQHADQSPAQQTRR
jgi:hypothetical protein